MKKAIIIIGGLTVIGVGAYLVLKPKKGAKDLGNPLGTDISTINPSNGKPVPKVNEVPQVSNSTQKAQEAVTLAGQIFELKNKKNKYATMSISEFFKTKEGKGHFSFNLAMSEAYRQKVLKDFDNELKILNDKIVALGYIEVNGSIAKLNL